MSIRSAKGYPAGSRISVPPLTQPESQKGAFRGDKASMPATQRGIDADGREAMGVVLIREFCRPIISRSTDSYRCAQDGTRHLCVRPPSHVYGHASRVLDAGEVLTSLKCGAPFRWPVRMEAFPPGVLWGDYVLWVARR